MKRILALMLVLGMASFANAALWFSVNGVEDPPDTSIELPPSEHAVIDIWGDGQTPPGVFYLGISAGDKGAYNIDNVVIPYIGNPKSVIWENNPDIAGFLGIDNPYVLVTLTDLGEPAPLNGLLVDQIDFHCTGAEEPLPDDVTLLLFDEGGNLLVTQVIHQIPEPASMLLLGLGGLALLRKKRCSRLRPFGDNRG